MIPLTSEQKELLFDYCFGLTSPEQTIEAEKLIKSNQQAAEIYLKLNSALKPLTSIEPEACPDSLAEGTVWRLNSLAETSQDKLQKLLASEQKRQFSSRHQIATGFGRRLATAAVLMIVGTILVTSFKAVTGYARYHSLRQQCQTQQSSIFQGLDNFITDHGHHPAAETSAGDVWWKVGYQGDENHSNTRHVYLLVKEGYVKPANFVCPASKYGEEIQMTPEQLSKFKDFPSRRYVTYSFQIMCRKASNGKLLCRNVIMADWNPIFEQLPDDFSKELNLRLNKKLLSVNSINHKRSGQNVLFGDGRVEFLKTRLIGTDDIFTLRDTDVYNGCEMPSCETDFFLAP